MPPIFYREDVGAKNFSPLRLPGIHRRRFFRLRYYAQAVVYFITICTHNRECLFGETYASDL